MEQPSSAPASGRVTVVDVQIPFLSLVVLIIKITLAAVPAALVIFVLSAAGAGFFAAAAAQFSPSRQSAAASDAAPTLEGLRGIVLGQGLPCFQAQTMQPVDRLAGSSTWLLDCAAGPDYEITLSSNLDVMKVVRK